MMLFRPTMAVIVLLHLATISLPTPLPPVKQALSVLLARLPGDHFWTKTFGMATIFKSFRRGRENGADTERPRPEEISWQLGYQLNEFIRYSEPAVYDAEPFKWHRRLKRSAQQERPLRINFKAHNREFKLVLRPDRSIFAEDAIFEGTSGKRLQFDPGKAYVGTLEDDEQAVVHGIVTEDGLFDGTISTKLEDYYIEPVHRYLKSGETFPSLNYHSIMYRDSDILHPNYTNCASEKLYNKYKNKLLIKNKSRNFDNEIEDRNIKPYRSRKKRWFPFEELETSKTFLSVNNTSGIIIKRPLNNNRHHIIVNSPTTVYHFGNNSSNVHILTNSVSKMGTEHVSDNVRIIKVSGLTPTIINRPKQPEDLPNNVLNETRHQKTNTGHNRGNFPKILIGTGNSDDSNLVADADDIFNARQHTFNKRAIIDPKKTTCMLYLQADHLFFQKYGTEEACIEVMTRHVQRVNSIYRATDFNQDGKSDNISFMIKRIKVHTTEALHDPSYRFPGNYGVEKFLELFSEEDYDAFCLAYMFTYRDFEMGTLGLAWTGDLKNAGGVCEKNGHYRGSMKSLNTGIVTLLNYGKHVPPAVSHVTLAHEIGHNFGSPHDPEVCTPGGEDGNFIMFARATSGDKKNNNQFSPCSLNSISPVLNAKARSPKGCFTEPQAAICGNGVVEVGEQCDCGWEEDCRDQCCYPQRRYPPPDEPPCRLTPRSMCSPSQGPCCTSECKLKFGDKCRDDNGCRDSSFCDGRGPHCPPSINKPNKTVCNEEFVCFMGECTGSICLAYGLESCQCIPEPNDPSTKACELCCKLPGDNQPCLSSFAWNSAPYDIPDLFSKPGTPCNDYNGYCDVFQKCREVDPSGPLATLRKLLLSEESIASFKRWMLDRWYYAALIFSSILLILVLSTRLLGKTTDLKMKAITIIHSSTTETVRLPPTDGENANIVVHPAAVRSKLPLKRRVYETSHRHRVKEAVVKKSKKSEHVKRQAEGTDETPVQSPRKIQKKSQPKKKKKPVKIKNKKKEVIDYSSAQEKIPTKTPEDDPLGKVRNWLLNSHNIAGSLVVRKSKSSPAGFLHTEQPKAPRSPVKVHHNHGRLNDERAKSGSLDANNKDPQVKLQVVYKPPFKFSVKLKKSTEVATNVVKKINSQVNQRQQRAAVLVRGNDRKRTQGGKRKIRPGNSSGKQKNINKETEKMNLDEKKKTKESIKENTKEDKSKSSKVDENNTELLRLISVDKQSEPVYQNTGLARIGLDEAEHVYTEEEEVKACIRPENNVDLLRMTSVEHNNLSQLPITPEYKNVPIRRNSSLDEQKKLRRDPSRESRIKADRNSLNNEKCVDLMRFPSIEANNQITTKLKEPVLASTSGDSNKTTNKINSLRVEDAVVDSDLDSNIHNVPSDLEVLLSESEYLFSDA